MARILVLLTLVLLVSPARAAEYDPLRSGHPLRIVAYVLHPVGVLLDRLIFRPAWFIGVKEPARTVFGVQVPPEDEPRDAQEEPAEPSS
jgi:hypothetical protein